MSELVVTAMPDACANMSCTNRSGEGQFVLVGTPGGVVSTNNLPLRLWMCYPCAMVLSKFVKNKKGRDR